MVSANIELAMVGKIAATSRLRFDASPPASMLGT
jgi:hypothetical protein